MPRRPWTVESLIRHGARRFRAHRITSGHGIPDARGEAELLAVHALGLSPGIGANRRSRRLSAAQATRVMALFSRRILERKPAAYLTGHAWLEGIRFQVDERVLVPRSYIAELLRDGLAPWIPDAGAVRTALDLGTGSGCLAILMAYAFPRARIDAADLSSAALDVARINVRAHRLGRRIRIVRSDMFAALRGERYDLIVSNPPYVRATVMRRLPPEYRAEPRLALAGGADGLDFVRVLLRDAHRYLNPGGLLVVEVGHNRGLVERAYPRVGFVWPETSGGDDCVFLLSRGELQAARSLRRAPRAASRPARPRSRAGTSGRA